MYVLCKIHTFKILVNNNSRKETELENVTNCYQLRNVFYLYYI